MRVDLNPLDNISAAADAMRDMVVKLTLPARKVIGSLSRIALSIEGAIPLILSKVNNIADDLWSVSQKVKPLLDAAGGVVAEVKELVAHVKEGGPVEVRIFPEDADGRRIVVKLLKEDEP